MLERQIKFNKQNVTILYRSEADLSVIEEIFVDKMYRAVENIIPTLTYPVLDIGAHIGLFSIYASLFNPKIKIIALEPEPNNFDLMKKNLKLNHCKNVTAKQLALVCHPDTTVIPAKAEIHNTKLDSRLRGNDNETTTLYLNEDSHNHSTFYETENKIEVSATTLEDLIKKPAVAKAMAGKVGLLKMDIEGAEFEILKNLESDTWNKIQYIAVEYHEFKNNKRADLENIIRSHGFSVEHFPNHFDKRFGLLLCRNKKSS